MPTTQDRGATRIVDVDRQLQNDRLRWWSIFGVTIGLTLVLALIAYSSPGRPFSLAIGLLVVSCVAAFLRPVVGVYLIFFLTLVGDYITMEWWPFTKNLSSRESIMYVNDQLILNPLELLGAVTVAAWLLQRLADPTWRFRRGALLSPVLVFTGFILIGVVRGKASGGDTRAAIYEFRPLLYFTVVYLLVTNLMSTRHQYRSLVLLSMVAISLQSIFSLFYYRNLPVGEKELLETLGEHSATVHMDALFILLLGLWLLRGRGWMRWTLIVLAVPVVYAYVLSQRRAAMVALFVGVFMVMALLFYKRRRLFWVVVPTLVVLLVGLIGATWNTQGGIGLPAQAVKSAFFPNSVSAADAGSDLYRQIERYDLYFTIRSSPLTGLGFGQKFYTPIALPDISFFEFWNYLPHNSILWIWIKTGFFGFVSMLYLFVRTVQLGARSLLAVRTPDQVALVLTGVTYVVMFVVFGYVDMVWSTRSTVFLALAFALCADYRLALDETARSTGGLHVGQMQSVR